MYLIFSETKVSQAKTAIYFYLSFDLESLSY